MRRLIVSVAIVVAFVAAAQYYVGWGTLLAPWRELDNPWLLLAPMALTVLTYPLRALRVDRYFKLREFGLCLRMLIQHTALLILLPMRTGEAAFPILMSRYFGVSPRRSLPALLWLRALDVHALMFGVIVAIAFATGAAVAVLAAFVWALLPVASLSMSRAIATVVADRDTKSAGFVRTLIAAVPRSIGGIVEDWLLTAGNWALKILSFAWVIHIFAADSYRSAFAGAVAGEIAATLPFNGFAGFGTYEASVVAGMQSLGVSVETALQGAVNVHFFSLATMIAITVPVLLIPRRIRALATPRLAAPSRVAATSRPPLRYASRPAAAPRSAAARRA